MHDGVVASLLLDRVQRPTPNDHLHILAAAALRRLAHRGGGTGGVEASHAGRWPARLRSAGGRKRTRVECTIRNQLEVAQWSEWRANSAEGRMQSSCLAASRATTTGESCGVESTRHKGRTSCGCLSHGPVTDAGPLRATGEGCARFNHLIISNILIDIRCICWQSDHASSALYSLENTSAVKVFEVFSCGRLASSVSQSAPARRVSIRPCVVCVIAVSLPPCPIVVGPL